MINMKYLFWNTHKNEKINLVLIELIAEYDISMVILAEYTADMNELLTLLNICGLSMEQYPTIGCDRIHILGKRKLNIEPHLQTDHSSIQIIDRDIILCAIHLNSKIYSDHEEIRNILIRQIITDIRKVEEKLNSNHTIIVGDFNINPYDRSCINAQYFHGMPIYEESKRQSRKIAGQEFYMFYNPMWNFLGDFNKPYGTYYHNSSDSLNTYWNIFDQVILRPQLRGRFVDKSLEIITHTRKLSLLDRNGHPNHDISDHLPIVFEIKENDYE